jgi:hypothetical protein
MWMFIVIIFHAFSHSLKAYITPSLGSSSKAGNLYGGDAAFEFHPEHPPPYSGFLYFSAVIYENSGNLT